MDLLKELIFGAFIVKRHRLTRQLSGATAVGAREGIQSWQLFGWQVIYSTEDCNVFWHNSVVSTNPMAKDKPKADG